MLIGYARVSREEQNLSTQIDSLKSASCQRIFEDKASGSRWDRPEFQKMLDQLRADDVIVVWKLDRISRSLRDLVIFIERIAKVGAGFRSLTEHIDTTTPAGMMLTHMLGAFAEFERAMIRERTRAGLDQARKEGRVGGRPNKVTKDQAKEIKRMVEEGRPAVEAARLFNLHPSTVSRLIRM